MNSFDFSRVVAFFSFLFFVHTLASGQKMEKDQIVFFIIFLFCLLIVFPAWEIISDKMKKNECFACLVRFFQDRFFYGKI